MKKTYRQRQKRLTELLRSHPLGAYLHICGEAAGLHLLLEVQLPCTEQELVQAAAEAHVVVYGLSDYYETPQAVPPTPQIVLATPVFRRRNWNKVRCGCWTAGCRS